MALAIAQFTITDFNDVNISTTQPSTPQLNQLWLDTSIVPNQLKRWDGTKWVVTNDTSALESRVSTAEQKITPTAIMNTVSSSTTYQNDLGAKLNTSDLSTKIQQSSSDVKIAIGQIGGNNLLKNGTFRFGLTNWGTPTTGITPTTGFDSAITDSALTLTNANATAGYYWSDAINVIPSTEYTLSGWVWNDTPIGSFSTRGQKSTNTGITYSYTHSVGTISPQSKWVKFSLTFTTSADEIRVRFRLDHNGGGGSVKFSQLKLEKGKNDTAWSAHDGEIFNALATFNDTGLQISHSNAQTKTLMNADGFRILNNAGDEIGSLASQSGLTQLTADTITANNVYTVDNLNRTLYVNGTTGLDTNAGTSAAPFRTVKQALNTLATYGRVRSAETKGLIYVYGAIAEDIYIRNFVGGVLELRFDRTCTINGKISVEYCSAQVNMYGGRTSSSDTGGCLITNKEVNATAINVYYSSVLYIDGFRITNKGGNGICFTGSTGFVFWCDINYCNGTQMACIKARFNSNVGLQDCVGSNNGISLYADYGSVINIGQQGNAAAVAYPNSTSANYGVYGGYIYALSTITKTNSAYAPAATTTQIYATYWNPTSTGSWRDVYNSWRSDNNYIYQGEYNGGGNHRGFMIFDSASIRTALSGATIHDIQLRLVRRNSGGNSAAQTVYLMGHSYTTTGGGYDVPVSYGAIGSWAWGEDKWVTIPMQAATDFKNGVIQGLAIYSSSRSPYMTFDISAQLWIKYEK